ncbi:MAG: GEVED domain-containing protein [Chitinophagales bacterium]
MKHYYKEATLLIAIVFILGELGIAQNLSYCPSKGNSTLHGYIAKVSIEGINNASGNNNGYHDFTSLSAKLQKGADYTIQLSPGFINIPSGGIYFEYWSVYIDFNQNGIFESNEMVTHGNSAIKINKGFLIPATALTGSTRMRIQMQPGVEQTNPCAVFAFGEVEDYSVVLVNSINKIETAEKQNASIRNSKEISEEDDKIRLFPNPAKNSLAVQLNINFNANNKIEVYNSLGKQVLSVQSIESSNGGTIAINTSTLANGIYFMNIMNNQQIVRKRFVISR